MAEGDSSDRAALLEEIARLRSALGAMRTERTALHQFLNIPALAITQMDRDGTILFINERGAENLGQTPAQLEGRSMWELLPGLAEASQARIARTLASGEPVSSETAVPLPSGERWFRSTYYPAFGEQGKATSVHLVSEDVTELKRAERLLAASEGRLAVILEHAPQLIAIFDSNGLIRYLNRAPKGHSESDLIGSRVTDIIASECVQPFEEALGGVFDDAEARVLELEDRIGGTWEVRLAPILQNGRVHQVLAFAVDISARKATEERERRLEAQVQHSQKLESLGVLAGGIAHDFNNILVGVLGNAQLALDDVGPGRSRAYLQDIVQAARRAADLCGQMLAYAGRSKLSARPVSMSAIVLETLDLVRPAITTRARLETDCPNDLPAVMGDATQLAQVVLNLITNASDAIGQGEGTIRVRSGVLECDRAFLQKSFVETDLEPGPCVSVEVQDTGCGMNDETRRRMFDPFFSSKPVGGGLGLAAVLGIVRRHGGAIVVDSRPGHGTTVIVTLPMTEARADHPAVPTPSDSGMRGTVLVVDDDDMVRDVARRILEAAGYRVLIAVDGADALLEYDANAPNIDAVLLDVSMPRMNGHQALAELRKRSPTLPVIMASGYSIRSEQANAEDRRTGFLAKPYERTVLLAAVDRALADAG